MNASEREKQHIPGLEHQNFPLQEPVSQEMVLGDSGNAGLWLGIENAFTLSCRLAATLRFLVFIIGS